MGRFGIRNGGIIWGCRCIGLLLSCSSFVQIVLVGGGKGGGCECGREYMIPRLFLHKGRDVHSSVRFIICNFLVYVFWILLFGFKFRF
jgi:hypothetical protein